MASTVPGGAGEVPEGGVPEGGVPSGVAFRWGRGRPVWEASAPSPSEVEALCRRFPEEVRVPEDLVSAQSSLWAETAAVAKSLGRRVSLEAVVREIRRRAGVRGDVSASYVDKGVFVLRFEEKAVRDLVLSSPWTVSGQALAMEPWRPRLLPVEEAVTTARVWVRLPCLPAEYWTPEVLKVILRPAGEMVAADECTASRRRLSFARVCLRISLALPLRPGVVIAAAGGSFWQTFVYESVDGVCLSCGSFHVPGRCSGGGDQPASAALSAANLMQQEVEGLQEVAVGPVLGKWSLAVRRWLPASDSRKVVEEAPPSRRPGKVPVGQSEKGGQREAGQRLDDDRWVKPAKVARRIASPRHAAMGGADGARGSSGSAAGRFGALAALGGEETMGVLGMGGKPLAEDGPPPETTKPGREGFSLRPVQHEVGGVGSCIELGPAHSKRARPDEGSSSRLKGPSLPVGRRGQGGSSKGCSRKFKAGPTPSSASQVRDLLVTEASSPGLFVFDARSISQADQDMGSSSVLPSSGALSLTHEQAVQCVVSALQEPAPTSLPMDALEEELMEGEQSDGPDGTASGASSPVP